MDNKISYEEFINLLGLIPCELASAMYELYLKYKEKEDERNN